MDHTIFEVRHCNDGQWKVFEGSYCEPLASFVEKHDAIEFAWDMAAMRHPAGIRVLAADGFLLGTRMTAMEASSQLPLSASYSFPNLSTSLW